MPNAWTVFMNKFRRRYGDDPWAAQVDGALPTDEVFTGARLRDSDRVLLYFTKHFVQLRFDGLGEEIREADYWRRFAVPTSPYIRGFGLAVKHYQSIRFIGDLDPCDLSTFRALQCGSSNLVPRRDWHVPLKFVGVNSRWIDLVERRLGTRLPLVTIKMGRLEREQYRALRKTWPELPSVVGERAMDLLDGGHKLEVEGATAMHLHDKEFQRELLDLLFGDDPKRREILRTIRSGIESEALDAAATFRPNSEEQASLWRFLRESDAPAHNKLASLHALYNVDASPDPWRFVQLVRDNRLPLVINAKAAEISREVLLEVGRRHKEFRYAVESLTYALQQEAPQVRFFAAFVLGSLRVKSALPELRELARTDRRRVDGWWTIAVQARDAIAHIETGAWPESRRRRELLAESRRNASRLTGAKR